jgi:Winged helix-turn-helix domain (DUF2582)
MRSRRRTQATQRRLWQWRRSTLEEMNKALKLKESVAWMTLGWLAREDKIEIEQAGKTEKLSLK